MIEKTSFSDKFLIQAAIDYVYRISRFDIHTDPVKSTTEMMMSAFNKRYKPILIQNHPITRINEDKEEEIIELRYILVEDSLVKPVQHALIFQGSDVDFQTIFSGKDTDWSNNLSTAVHLPTAHYQNAINEFERLNNLKQYNITATSGNSLGGGYALSLGEFYPDLRIIAVNPAPPEFNKKFTQTAYSTIINTSTDLLTRMLETDISRYKKTEYTKIKQLFDNEDLSALEKTKEFDKIIYDLDYQVGYFYGFDTYPVKRSLFYNEPMYIEAAHRGTILEPREVSLEIFKNNIIPYSSGFASKIFSQTKELLEYSRYFLKLSTNLISSAEYRDLVDNYIQPAFMPIHTNKVKDFKNFVSLANFLQYDILSKNLLVPNGNLLIGNDRFKINDKAVFINNLNESIIDYKKAVKYPINRVIHDSDEERFFADNKTDLNQVMTFFASSFDINLNFNLDIIDVFKGLPVTILFKIGELIDKNWRFFKGLKENLLVYIENEDVVLNDPTVIKHYRDTFKQVSMSILDYHQQVISNLETLQTNVDYVVNNSELKTSNIHFIQDKKIVDAFVESKKFTLNEKLVKKIKEINNNNLIVKQFNDVLNIIDQYRVSSGDRLNNSIGDTEEVLRSSIQFINKKASKNEEYRLKKLSTQLEAMLKNVDLTTIYYNSLNVFRKDIAAIALRNTVSQSIITNYHQIIETNNQLVAMLNNLSHYVEANTSKYISKRLIFEIETLKKDVYSLNKYVKLFIE